MWLRRILSHLVSLSLYHMYARDVVPVRAIVCFAVYQKAKQPIKIRLLFLHKTKFNQMLYDASYALD